MNTGDPVAEYDRFLRAKATLASQGYGVELNRGYFLDAVRYLQAEERKHGMPTLFDTLTTEAAA